MSAIRTGTITNCILYVCGCFDISKDAGRRASSGVTGGRFSTFPLPLAGDSQCQVFTRYKYRLIFK